MTANLVTTVYGMKELTALNHSYTYRGLTIAIILHLFIVGLYYGLSPVFATEVLSQVGPGLQWVPFAPTPISASTSTPVGRPVFTPSVNPGIPVPVPDPVLEEDPPTDIAKDLPPYDGSPGDILAGFKPGLSTGTEGVPMIDETVVDISGTKFVPLEKWPIIVRQVKPQFPELGRKLGMEGTVFVKLLIDKEGFPRKAEILKSDNELFNESAKEAA